LTSIIKIAALPGSVKVPLHIVLARRDRLEELVKTHRYLPIKDLCERLGVSEATVRRDLAALEQDGRLTRTYGGALSDYDARFPSFGDRQRQNAAEKQLIAQAALSAIRPGMTCFFDSGTTIFAISEILARNPIFPLTIVTSNLPVAEHLAPVAEIPVFLTGGQLFPRQSVLLGDAACKSIESWSFDLAFLSAEGLDSEGLWNSQEAIVQLQKTVVRRSDCAVFCLDRSKLGKSAPQLLLPSRHVETLLTNGTLEDLKKLEIPTPKVFWQAKDSLPPDLTLPAEESSDLPVHFL
jgi:DeoR/GlpR family transcriptional regulator of sugar metabolism